MKKLLLLLLLIPNLVIAEKYKCAETQEAKDDYNKKNNNEYQWWRDDDYIVTEDNWKEGCIPLKMERSDKKTVKKWTQDFKKKKVANFFPQIPNPKLTFDIPPKKKNSIQIFRGMFCNSSC